MIEELELYDTTLRDGAQQEGISLSVDDKLKIQGLDNRFVVFMIDGNRISGEFAGKSITLVFSGTSLIIVVPIPTKQSFPILIF